jgi:hypothetical protein
LGVNIKQSIVALLIILTFSVYFVSVQQAIAQADQATSKMQAANDAVKRAFNAVLDAEKAGANVIGLLAQINTVQGILAQAENSYRTGNTNSAAAQADNVFSIAQQITTAAQNAKQDAIISSQNNFWLTIAFTVVSTIMFLEALILFWLWFKRRYIKNLSEAKPEVVNNET